MKLDWLRLSRRSHAWVGIFSALTLGIIAISCFPIAHEWEGFGKTLADIHMGKFLAKEYQWIWIDSQGLLLAWLVVSGFLIHRKARRRQLEKANDADGRILILFGTQTGNAENLAEQFAKKCAAASLPARVTSMEDHGYIDLSREHRCVAFISTYGEGEMPDSAVSFWESLTKPEARTLQDLEYAVLGLGDHHYEHFCKAGQDLDNRFHELGAKRVLSLAKLDTDFQSEAHEWMTKLLQIWAPNHQENSPALPLRPASIESTVELPMAEPKTRPAHPTKAKAHSTARITDKRFLTRAEAGKQTQHLAFTFEDSNISYQPGAILSVQPSNCPLLVEHTLQALGCDGEEAVALPGDRGEVSLRKALLDNYEITRVSKALVQKIAERSDDDELKSLAFHGNGELSAFIQDHEVLDLLFEYPKAQLSAHELVSSLQPLRPRLYSIASSSTTHPGEVHLTVGVVEYHTRGHKRLGVCSNFLANRVRECTPIPVKIQPSRHFYLPKDPATDIIMIGPGTGIAPFRAFLEERRATGAKGRNWLFFGERYKDSCFYYQEEWKTMQADGYLHRMDTAFSRDGRDKVYVQDRMAENGKAIWDWLEQGANFYVCGDATRMARDVDHALRRIVETYGALSCEKAEAYVRGLKESKRYQRDVY